MKDGRTRLAHKAEHAVDLETGAVVGVSVQDADAGDTQTMLETLVTAAEQVDAVLPAGPGIAELVCDKGYHSNQTLVTLAEVEIRSYVSEPGAGATGAGSTSPVTRCMPTGDGFAAHAVSGYCVGAVNASNVPMRISTQPDGCAACTCADTATSSSACSCRSAA